MRLARVAPIVVLLSRDVTAAPHPLADGVDVGDATCMERASVLSSIESWLGRGTLDASLHIVIRAAGDSDVEFVVLERDEVRAERRFSTKGRSCADVRAAVSLAVAIAVDTTVLKGIADVPAREEPRAREPILQPPRPTPERSRHTWSTDAELLAFAGAVPSTTWGAALGAAWSPARRAWIRGHAFTTVASTSALAGGQTSTSLRAGQADVCRMWGSPHRSVWACAGAAAGWWEATGRGFSHDTSTRVTWAAVTTSLEAQLALDDDLWAIARLDGLAPIVRPSLEVTDGSGRVAATKQASTVGGAIGFGARVAF